MPGTGQHAGEVDISHMSVDVVCEHRLHDLFVPTRAEICDSYAALRLGLVGTNVWRGA